MGGGGAQKAKKPTVNINLTLKPNYAYGSDFLESP